jgi:hypothetical protein
MRVREPLAAVSRPSQGPVHSPTGPTVQSVIPLPYEDLADRSGSLQFAGTLANPLARFRP